MLYLVDLRPSMQRANTIDAGEGHARPLLRSPSGSSRSQSSAILRPAKSSWWSIWTRHFRWRVDVSVDMVHGRRADVHSADVPGNLLMYPEIYEVAIENAKRLVTPP